MNVKRKVHNEYVLPVMVYGSETWALKKAHMELLSVAHAKWSASSDMPHGTDRPYPIRILAFFEMIRPYQVVIRISGNLWGKNCKSCSV